MTTECKCIKRVVWSYRKETKWLCCWASSKVLAGGLLMGKKPLEIIGPLYIIVFSWLLYIIGLLQSSRLPITGYLGLQVNAVLLTGKLNLLIKGSLN